MQNAVKDKMGRKEGRANRVRVEEHSAWLTPQDAAQYLRVGIDIIYDGCAAGGLRHSKLGHRTIRIRREWVDLWAEEHAAEHR